MKKIYFLCLLLIVHSSLDGQKKSLDSTVFDGWRGVKNILVSGDGDAVFTEYESFADKHILEIKVEKFALKKEIKGGEQAKFLNGQKVAVYKVKDALFLIDLTSGKTHLVTEAKSFDCKEESPVFTFKKGKDIYITKVVTDEKGSLKNSLPPFKIQDSVSNVINSTFAGDNRVVMLVKRDSSLKGTDLISFTSHEGKDLKREPLYSTSRYIRSISANKKGDKLIFYESDDSSGIKNVECILLKLDDDGKVSMETPLPSSLLPDGMRYNYKKDISFSKDEDYLKFEIAPLDEKEAKDVKSKIKGKFEYELWRWRDTLLPSQKRDIEGAFARSFKCAYYVKENKFVRLSYGKGVFLMPDDNSPFGFELDNRPYMYTHLWEDPVAKDFYSVNAATGERWMFEKDFKGQFAVSPATAHVFTFEPGSGAWYVTDLINRRKRIISDIVPFPLKDRLFDKPQSAGSYGQAGLNSDNRYFIIYDEFDIWAVPVAEEDKRAICLTNGYGRRHNIRFKILNTSSEKGKKEGVNLDQDIVLDAVNLNNMNSGYYKVKIGKDPVALIESPHKYSFSRKVGKNYFVVKRESFNEAPDYWLTDRNFKLIRRLTALNEQLKDYKTGNVK